MAGDVYTEQGTKASALLRLPWVSQGKGLRPVWRGFEVTAELLHTHTHHKVAQFLSNPLAPLLGTCLSERSPHLVISNSLMVEVGWEEEGTERGLTSLSHHFLSPSPPIQDPEFP